MSYCGRWYDCPHCGEETPLETRETGVDKTCPACGHKADEHVMDEFGFCRHCDGQHPFVRDSAAHLAHPQRPQWMAVTSLTVRPDCRREDSRIIMFGDVFKAEVDITYPNTFGIDMY